MNLIGKKHSTVLMLIRRSEFLFINMLCNFILHATFIYDDRDPPWMNKEIKKFIHGKKNIFNCFRWSNNVKQLLDRSSDPIKLSHSKIQRKILFTNNYLVIWYRLKLWDSLVHFEKFPYGQKELPCILPLLEKNENIKDFKKNAEMFNLVLSNLLFLINQ